MARPKRTEFCLNCEFYLRDDSLCCYRGTYVHTEDENYCEHHRIIELPDAPGKNMTRKIDAAIKEMERHGNNT